tara:strand:+ start:1041 stop:1553 length:513 start_codon:yes stop_codon:yes gene_type:complete
MMDKISEHCGCPIKDKLRPILLEYIGTTRALHLWFHGAHHVTRGTGFLGDHIHLYGEIYKKIQDDIDTVIEKSMSILEDESVACPAKICRLAGEILDEYPSPSQHTSLAIAAHGKTLMVSYLKMLDSMFKEIQSTDAMTLGLEDLISSTCNEYETFVYLLQQREKSELED